jgi:hypothetical protein
VLLAGARENSKGDDMQVDDKLFTEVVRELDLYIKVMSNLLTDSQLDRVSTVGSQLVGIGDAPSAVKLRDRCAITASILDRAAKLLTPNTTGDVALTAKGSARR